MTVTWRRDALALCCIAFLTACGGGGDGSSIGTGGSPSGPPRSEVPLAVLFSVEANDVVWDERRQLLYLSLPSAAGPNGNAVIALDPTTNTVVRSQFAGSEPNILSISDDGQYLYAGVDGSASVERLRLPDLTPDLTIPLGRDAVGGPYHAVDLAAVPGSPRSFVVGLSVYSELASVLQASVFDDAVARPLTVAHCACASFQWVSNSQLYAANNENTGFDFLALQVEPAGLRLLSDTVGAFSAFYSRAHYSPDTRLVYSDDGTVFDPVAGRRVTQISVRGPMVPDTARNRLFYAVSEGTVSIVALDATTYQPVGSPLPITANNVQPSRMVRWGSDGLALTAGQGGVLLFGGKGISRFDTAIPVRPAQRVVIPGTVNRLVWNPATARLYATMSQSSPNLAGSIVVIDPATSQVTASRYIGGEPGALAVSDDGQYLYVGLDEIGTVERLRLPGLNPDATLVLGAHVQFGTYVAGDIEVAPGTPRTVAISRFSPGVVPAEQGGIVVFDDAVARPVAATREQQLFASYGDLSWSSDGSTIYSSNFTGADLYLLAVDASGVRHDRTIGGVFATPGHLHPGYGDGLLYHDSGRVVDPSSGAPLGSYRPGDNRLGAELITASLSPNRVFTIAAGIFEPGEVSTVRIDAFDKARFTPVARHPIGPAQGFPFDFVQTAAQTFAFRSVEGVWLVSVP